MLCYSLFDAFSISVFFFFLFFWPFYFDLGFVHYTIHLLPLSRSHQNLVPIMCAHVFLIQNGGILFFSTFFIRFAFIFLYGIVTFSVFQRSELFKLIFISCLNKIFCTFESTKISIWNCSIQAMSLLSHFIHMYVIVWNIFWV